MSGGMISFLAGLSGGYATGKQKSLDNERQAKLDARDDMRFQRESDAIARDNKLRSDLSAAGKDAVVDMATPMLNMGDGAKVYDMPQGADVASSDARQLRRMAPDAPAATASQAPTLNGKVYDSAEAVQKAATEYNMPDARGARLQSALMSNGKPLEAMQMQSTAMDMQSKRLGLDAAQLKAADDQFNRGIMQGLGDNPDWTKGAAKMLTDSQQGGLAGMTITSNISTDGKTVNFMGAGADGASKSLMTLPNTPEGKMSFLQSALRSSPETKITWLMEQSKLSREDRKDKQTQDNWQKSFGLQQQAFGLQQQSASRLDKVSDMQLKAGDLAYKKALEDYKIPAAVKLQVDGARDELKTIGTAMAKAQAEGMWNLESVGVKQLLSRQAVLTEQMRGALAPYVPSAKSDAAAPFGSKARVVENPMNMEPTSVPATSAAPASILPPKASSATPNKPVVGMTSTVAASRASATPEQMQAIDIRAALGASGNSTADQVVAEKVPALQAASARVQDAKAKLASISKSGDVQALTMYAQQVQQANAEFDSYLKDMTKEQANAVRTAAGHT